MHQEQQFVRFALALACLAHIACVGCSSTAEQASPPSDPGLEGRWVQHYTFAGKRFTRELCFFADGSARVCDTRLHGEMDLQEPTGDYQPQHYGWVLDKQASLIILYKQQDGEANQQQVWEILQIQKHTPDTLAIDNRSASVDWSGTYGRDQNWGL